MRRMWWISAAVLLGPAAGVPRVAGEILQCHELRVDGTLTAGTASQLASADGSSVCISSHSRGERSQAGVALFLKPGGGLGKVAQKGLLSLDITCSVRGVGYHVDVWHWQSAAWIAVDVGTLDTASGAKRIPVFQTPGFVSPGTGEMRVRVICARDGQESFTVRVDRATAEVDTLDDSPGVVVAERPQVQISTPMAVGNTSSTAAADKLKAEWRKSFNAPPPSMKQKNDNKKNDHRKGGKKKGKRHKR